MAAANLDQPSRRSIDNRTNPDGSQARRNNPDSNDGGGKRSKNKREKRSRVPKNETELQKGIREAYADLDRVFAKEKEKKKGTKGGKLIRLTETQEWESAPKEVSEKPPFLSLEVSPRRMVGIVATPMAALGYLGYKVVEEVGSASATLSDRVLKRVADFGEGLIDKSLPGMKWLNKLMGKVEKKIGLDKLLHEVLEKDEKARKKLLDKLLKDENAAIKKYNKSKKQKKAKAQQKKEWTAMFGENGAAILAKARDDGESSVDVPKAGAGNGAEEKKKAV
jgi:hypothetical protein